MWNRDESGFVVGDMVGCCVCFGGGWCVGVYGVCVWGFGVVFGCCFGVSFGVFCGGFVVCYGVCWCGCYCIVVGDLVFVVDWDGDVLELCWCWCVVYGYLGYW